MHTRAEKSSDPAPKAAASSSPKHRESEQSDAVHRESVPCKEVSPPASSTPTIPDAWHTLSAGKNIVQPKAGPENKTGLPDGLKKGIEALSGFSMNDVRVHYGSQKPARLQASAFAQGTQIHVAPGQERHLPHEAWHVVQQKQGRVKPTSRLKKTGTPVNDDPALETEADVMGNRALQTPHKETAPAAQMHVLQKVTQRVVEWKPDNHPDNVLNGFAGALNTVVQAGADTALTEVDSLTGDDGYTQLWKDTALLLIARRDDNLDKGDVAEAQVATRFASARYGYAVEAYANDQRETLQEALPDGYTFAIQAGRGMTRPDFIVFDEEENEVGWFDITSNGSLGHIDRKTGAGWQNRAYVAEITYPALNIDNLSMGDAGIGVRVRARNAARRRREAWSSFVQAKEEHFSRLWNLAHSDADGKGVTRRTAKIVLGLVFSETNVTDGVAKNLLRAMGFVPTQFAFTQGGSKAEGEVILRQYYEMP